MRLHMFFFLFAIITLYLSMLHQDELGQSVVWVTASSLGILLVSVLLHEIAHHVFAVRLGGGSSQIVLLPWGGMTDHKPPHEPQAELAVAFAGPLVNFGVCLLCAPLLLLSPQADVSLAGLLHPLAPVGVIHDGFVWPTLLRLTFWINWVLLLVNLLPAFPFDGANALRAMLMMSVQRMDRRLASFIACWVARFTAFGLWAAAWMLRNENDTTIAPTWFVLVLLGVFLFFSAAQHEGRGEDEDEDDELFGYDFSQGYTSLERSVDVAPRRPGPVTRWLQRRRELKAQRQREIEADEERRVDEILARLHDQGIDSLSADDRGILDRVSARYRSRPGGRP